MPCRSTTVKTEVMNCFTGIYYSSKMSDYRHISMWNKIIRIFHGSEVQVEKNVRRSLFGITRLCPVMPDSDPEGQTFLCAPNNHDRFFFLHTLGSQDFNTGITINESHSYTLTSAILKVDIVCDVTMTSSPNVLTTKLLDLLYNQCIDNTCCYSFFIYPTGRIWVCKIRSISTGEIHGKPRLVCKKNRSWRIFLEWKFYFLHS